MQNGETWGQNPEDEYEGSFKQMSNDATPEAEQGPGLIPESARTPERDAKAQADYNAAFDEADDMEAERDVDDMREMAAEQEFEKVAEQAKEPIAQAAPKNFKEAFAAARKDGLKVFDWEGKKYTTKLAGTKDTKPANPVKPVAAPVDQSVPPRATFQKPEPKKNPLAFGPKLNPAMMPKEGAPSIYDKRKPVRQAGSGLEEQIPV